MTHSLPIATMQQHVLATHSAAPALHRSKRCRSAHGKASYSVRAAAAAVEAKQSPPAALTSADEDLDQHRREGAHEAELLQLQANKADPEQGTIADVLPAWDASQVADVAVVGCGPAGLALSAELAKLGLSVALIGRDVPFVNNYGVWLDEFEALGLKHTLDAQWKDAICYFKEGKEVRVGRAYGRVCRRKLREHMVAECAKAGVKFLAGEVTDVEVQEGERGAGALVRCADGTAVKCRLVNLAAGGVAGKFLRFEDGVPEVAAQTAYGIEAEVEGYESSYDPDAMLFMDFRRHHTGLYEGTAGRQVAGQHQNGGEGLWGTEGETPSFLYAMHLGGSRVFLEETCLVAKPPLPFAVLKRRLERRCAALGIKVKEIDEEEWSYIPVGGPLPRSDQPITAFGAAANLVHPATGYSLTRSLREAPSMARAIRTALEDQPGTAEAAQFVWKALWTQEKRRQASFNLFGMELLAGLDVANTADFFTTFFRLPPYLWQSFLASKLSSTELLGFALATFALAPLNIQYRLLAHFATHPAGGYMIDVYGGKQLQELKQKLGIAPSAGSGAAVGAAVVGLALLHHLAGTAV